MDGIRGICGDEVADKCAPVWGLSDEGEIQGICIMGEHHVLKVIHQVIVPPTGGLAQARYHSKHVSRLMRVTGELVDDSFSSEIKAKEEGIYHVPYLAKRSA